MSQQSSKSAYCSNCTKNVPHLRTRPATLKQWFGGVFDFFNIGPWYCLHCHKKMFVLPAINENAADYRIVDPLDVPADGTVSIWSKANGSSRTSVQTTIQSNGSELMSTAASIETEAETNLVIDLEPATEQDRCRVENISVPIENSGSTSGILDGEEKCDSCTLEQQAKSDDDELAVSTEELESLQRIDQMAKQNRNKLPEAESVGNFIKDRSLILRSTRMHRVSVKYRDSVVERILSGKVTIGQLTAAGEYTEGELVSWIADKVKRLNARIGELEDSIDRNWDTPSRHSGGFGPFGPR